MQDEVPKRTYALSMGRHMITDIMNPLATQIDLEEIEVRLRAMHRFSNNPSALTVHTHRELVVNLAHFAGERVDVLAWCRHHDDHEAVTGDIPGPLKALIGTETKLISTVEHRLDRAICEARGTYYPSRTVRTITHKYDKMAETIEWTLVLGNRLMDWCAPVDIPQRKQLELLSWARSSV